MQSIDHEGYPFPARIIRKISPYLSGPWFRVALVAIMLVIYALDLSTPLGVPVWLLYFIPLILAFWSKAPYAIPAVCAVTILFLASGFVFSPPGIQTTAALLIRMIFSAVFIGTSIILWMALRRQGRVEILQKI
ncbi:MAG: hypothetical protein MUF37_04050 [Methanoregulaceae archaeon]|nr:hypothetical protein [Methanoregulaceae archaeon]